MTFKNVAASREIPLVEIPLVSSNVDTFADDFLAIKAWDEEGELTLLSAVIEGPDQNARDATIGGKKKQWFLGRDPELSL